LPSDQDIRDFMTMIDTNANGKIEKNELVSFMRNLVS
jgi:Ca2+-binding EF-hand superfamily protein